EIVREVLGGPGIVGPVDRCDLQVRKAGVRVVLDDLRIVPTCDLLIEDLCDRVRAQVQRIHTVEVEHHRDRHCVGGQVDGRRTATPLQGVLGLVRVHRRVGTGKGHRVVDELVTATTRPDRVVIDACVLTPRLVTGDPGRHRIFLGAGPAPDKLPEKHSRSAGTSGAALSGTALSLPQAVVASNRPVNAAEAAPWPLRRRRLCARLRTVDGSTTASIPFVGEVVLRCGHRRAPVSGASSQVTEYRRKFNHLWSTTPNVPPWGTTLIEKVGGVHDTRSGWARVL